MLYVKRILSLYICWSLIYLPFKIEYYVENSNDFMECISMYAEDFFINGTYEHLWFLPAIVIGVIIVGILLKFISIRQIMGISLGILLMGTLISTYLPIIKYLHIQELEDLITNIETRNGIFYAFPYVAIGGWLAIDSQIIDKVTKSQCILGFITSMVLLGIESIVAIFLLQTTSTILWISVVPAVIYLFIFSMKWEIGMCNDIAKKLRAVTTLMYTSHFLIIIFLRNIIATNIREPFYGMVLFILSTLSTIFLSIICIKYSSKYTKLKILY